MAITFDRVNKYIIPDTDIVTIQEIYNASQDYLDEPGNLDLNVFVRASGKDDLDAITQTGITLTITEGWTIRWNARTATSPEFILRRISGGNLAEVNGELPITPSDGNTIVVQSSSSATIQNLEELQFGGEVWIDSIDGTAGVDFPLGTERFPTSNLSDGLLIAADRNQRRYQLRGTFSFDVALPGTEWAGFGGIATNIILSAGANLSGMLLSEMQFLGGSAGMSNTSPLEESTRLDNCAFTLGTVTNIHGILRRCIFTGATIRPTPGNTLVIEAGDSATAGSSPGLTVDMNNAPGNLNIRGFHGGIALQNVNDAATLMSIDLDASTLTLDASCVQGILVVRGVGNIVGEDLVGPNFFITRMGFVEGERVDDLWQLQGLDPNNPMTVDLLNDRRFVGQSSPAEIEQTVTKSSPEGEVTTITRTK